MVLDLALIAILSQAGWFFLGIGVGLVFFRLAFRSSAGWFSRGARLAAFGSLGTLTLATTLWWSGCFGSGLPSGGDIAKKLLETGVAGSEMSDAIGTAIDLAGLVTAKNAAEMQETATTAALRMDRLGVPPAEIRSTLDSIAVSRDEPWALGAVQAGFEAAGLRLAPKPRTSSDPDSLALAYAAALKSGDTLGAEQIRRPLGDALASARVEEQRRQISELETDKLRLQDELDSEKERGLLSLVLKVANEIGIEFGWSALYFTLFPTFWGGRTPGKRLLGIRIVRLDGRAIGWWAALNRFGGYAASIFTGLLGFFEMFWDDNRQALQDRIAATVVVREIGRA